MGLTFLRVCGIWLRFFFEEGEIGRVMVYAYEWCNDIQWTEGFYRV